MYTLLSVRGRFDEKQNFVQQVQRSFCWVRPLACCYSGELRHKAEVRSSQSSHLQVKNRRLNLRCPYSYSASTTLNWRKNTGKGCTSSFESRPNPVKIKNKQRWQLHYSGLMRPTPLGRHHQWFERVVKLFHIWRHHRPFGRVESSTLYPPYKTPLCHLRVCRRPRTWICLKIRQYYQSDSMLDLVPANLPKNVNGFRTTHTCELCGFEPKTKNKYREKQDHLVMKHFKEKIDKIFPHSRPYACPTAECGFQGKDKQALLRHYTGKHGILEKYLKEALAEKGKIQINLFSFHWIMQLRMIYILCLHLLCSYPMLLNLIGGRKLIWMRWREIISVGL